MTTEPVPAILSPSVRTFLEAPRFAVVATINLDGSPQQAVVWYLLEGDELVINSAEGRRWPANLRRDPRLSAAIEDEYYFVTLTGTVEVVDDQERAQADIAAMARRYHADDPAKIGVLIERFRSQQRVSFRIRPARVYEHFD